jgi:hypothetical protein
MKDSAPWSWLVGWFVGLLVVEYFWSVNRTNCVWCKIPYFEVYLLSLFQEESENTSVRMSQQYTPVDLNVKVLLCGEIAIFIFIYFTYNSQADGYENYEKFLFLL